MEEMIRRIVREEMIARAFRPLHRAVHAIAGELLCTVCEHAEPRTAGVVDSPACAACVHPSHEPYLCTGVIPRAGGGYYVSSCDCASTSETTCTVCEHAVHTASTCNVALHEEGFPALHCACGGRV